MSGDTQSLYNAATDVLTQQGAILIDDPFAGSDFPTRSPEGDDFRGFESFVYTMEKYLERLRPMAMPTRSRISKQRQVSIYSGLAVPTVGYKHSLRFRRRR